MEILPRVRDDRLSKQISLKITTLLAFDLTFQLLNIPKI